ncbi:MAG: SusC/RagA family TonB-linked outer membrane protein, partial [Flavobacteriaceae bacterium]|nr:SusC/RagA family TonB-linked outer membrane protein [Flavobacteriaceae bacterium]
MKTKLSGIMTLFLAFVVQFTFAQERTITGTVSDETGPLPGVSVIIEGTTTGTETNFDGNYILQAKNGDNLRFSFVGMTTVIRSVASNNVINVTMVSDVNTLDEVVVTAMGIKRQKKTLTYQAEKVDSEELVKVAPTRAAQGLTGKVAGLQINIQDNGVNPSSQIILRGLRSISKNNGALIVIDGTISTQAAFDDLNPLDIADINVLKGASAGVIYGSLGSNGALIVSTKRGKQGEKFTVGLNSTSTFESVAYMPEFQTEYGTGWAGAYDPVENTNWGPRFDGQVRQIGPTFHDGTFQAVPYAPVKDNLKDFYNTGTTLQNTLYFSGGGENSSFYMSIGDQRTDGIVPDDSYARNTFRVNATQTLGDLTLSLSSSFMKDKTNVVGSRIGDQDRPLYWFVLNTSANIPLSSYSDWQDPNGYGYADNYYNAYYQNPYWAVGQNRNKDTTSRLIANMQADWEMTDWLVATGRFGINTVSGHGKDYRYKQEYDASLQPSHSTVSSFVIDSEFQYLSYTTDALLNANFDDVADLFDITVLVGATNTTTESRSSFIRANNLSIPGFFDVSNGTGAPIVGVDEYKKRTYGFFTDINVGVFDFLYFNFAGRFDKTSTLPSEDNGYFYPAYGLSFVLSDAVSSIRDSGTYIKLTATNSTVYNDLSPYEINESYSQSGGFPFGSLNGFAQSGTAIDSAIKKEKINTTEFGANFGFFKNRLTLDAAYFITKSTDLITFTTPSVTSGSTSYLTNIGELEGKGFELSLGAAILRSEDWGWDVNINYTANKSTIISIADGVDEIKLPGGTGDYGVFAVVGETFPQLKATSNLRDSQGRIVINPSTGNPIKGDIKNLGNTTPDYIIGATSTFRWRTLSLSATMDYRTGHVYYEQGSDAMEFTGRSMESVSANRQDFVIPNTVYETSPGVFVENTNIPITGGDMNYWKDTYNDIKENYVKDATALKIRELSLSYALPAKYFHKGTSISAFRVGLIARNFFTWLPSENRFSDPEFNNSNSNTIGIGGYFQSPPTKSVGININIE